MSEDQTRHILIVHPEDDSVFTSDGQNLPAVSSTSFWNSNIDCLCRFVQESLNLLFDIVFLRFECDVRSESEFEPDKHILFVFDIPRNALLNTRKAGKWIAKGNVDRLRIEPVTRPVVKYLSEYATHGLDINADRLHPFSKLGWFEQTSVWTADVLSKAGFVTESVEQFQINDASCVLRVRTECGLMLFTKCCHPVGALNELAATVALSEEMPDVFLKPIGTDVERNLLLMEDYGPTLESLAESKNITDRDILRIWGKIQVSSISSGEQLLIAGVPVWDAKRFRSMFEDLFEDAEWWTFQQEEMSTAERSTYDKATCREILLTYLDDFLVKIGKYQVPLALVHGDLNSGNVIVREASGLAFIDFASTVWSFPFLDMAISEADSDDVEDIDFYLELWLEYETIDRLRDLYELISDFAVIYGTVKMYLMFKHSEESKRSYFRRQNFAFEFYALRDIQSE